MLDNELKVDKTEGLLFIAQFWKNNKVSENKWRRWANYSAIELRF